MQILYNLGHKRIGTPEPGAIRLRTQHRSFWHQPAVQRSIAVMSAARCMAVSTDVQTDSDDRNGSCSSHQQRRLMRISVQLPHSVDSGVTTDISRRLTVSSAITVIPGPKYPQEASLIAMSDLSKIESTLRISVHIHTRSFPSKCSGIFRRTKKIKFCIIRTRPIINIKLRFTLNR